LGLTVTIPGISFGTMALMFNIYEKTLNAFSAGNIKKNLDFTIPLFLGIVCGVFAFSNLVTWLITEHEIITYFAFIGLIIGCIPMIYKRAEIDRIKFRNVLAFIIALACTLVLAFYKSSTLENKTLDELGGLTPDFLVWIVFAGFVCAVAMLIPGISGSIILLMFGTYAVAVEAIAEFDMKVLLPLGASIVLGIVVGIKVINVLLKHHHEMVYSAALGLVIGSIFIVYPGFTKDMEGAIAIILAAAFALVSYLFSKKT